MVNLTHLFRVETLDARFASNTGEPAPDAVPSKWNTWEYYVYYVVFLIIPPWMFKTVYDCSQPTHPGYQHYEHLLEPGWVPGRKVDNSDSQYSGFRENIPYMAILLLAHPLLRRAYEQMTSSGAQKGTYASAADVRLHKRVSFDLAFAAIFLIAIHGVSAFKILTILWINYQIATAAPKSYVGIATWVFNISMLFANELSSGYHFADIASYVLPPQTTGVGEKAVGNWGDWLDSYGGLIPRWQILFNITVLRLIAFNFDYLWSLDRRAGSPVEKKNLDPANLSEPDRVNMGAKTGDFTFRNYVAYTLYSPLYLAGPIINFNDYIFQCRYPMPSIRRDRTILYGVRFLFCLLFMEIALHYLYPVAIAKSNPDWTIYTPFQVTMLGFFNLHIIWLKLLLPWRLFRLWSLMDGIDPPENMVRCMSDQPSTLAFWRGWHRSYNRWIIRYIFIPMGGSQSGSKVRVVLNYTAVFTFVALWHDINLRLLIWGWLIVLFLLPEVLARQAFPAKRWADRPGTYRWLCGVGAAGNCIMMTVANLVGFAVGLDGLKDLIDGVIWTLGGRVFMLGTCMSLFVGAQIMFEWRAGERRRGVEMKC